MTTEVRRRSPGKAKLAWNKREQRWRFRYRCRNYTVSPKQLECEDTAAASKEAAERWRDLRVAEADKQSYLQSAGALELMISLEPERAQLSFGVESLGLSY